MKKTMIMISFILVAFIIIFFAHAIVFLFLQNSFFPTNQAVSKFLGTAFVILSFSFIVSSAWLHVRGDTFSRIFYFLSGLWHGLLLNLFLAAIIYFSVLLLSDWLQFAFSKPLLGAILVFAAFTVSIFGIWNVYNLKVRTVTVASGNWPAAWHDKKAVMISDVHLGEVLNMTFLKNLNAIIEKEKPDIVFIPGDLFDGMDGGFENLKPELKKIKAKQAVYFVTGNHETYSSTLDLNEMLKDTDIMVLDDNLVVLDGVQILGVTYPKVGEAKDVPATILEMPGYQKEMPSILLYHIPEYLKQIKETGVNLMLSGHTHRGQMWPFNFITDLMYKGADHGLINDGDFSIYTSSGAGVWGPTMRTSSRSEIVVIKFNN